MTAKYIEKNNKVRYIKQITSAAYIKLQTREKKQIERKI